MPDERKNYWKEQGLNPGPLSQPATTQTSRPRADYPNGGHGRMSGPSTSTTPSRAQERGLGQDSNSFLSREVQLQT